MFKADNLLSAMKNSSAEHTERKVADIINLHYSALL